jgi:hypothetical protein
MCFCELENLVIRERDQIASGLKGCCLVEILICDPDRNVEFSHVGIVVCSPFPQEPIYKQSGVHDSPFTTSFCIKAFAAFGSNHASNMRKSYLLSSKMDCFYPHVECFAATRVSVLASTKTVFLRIRFRPSSTNSTLILGSFSN